MYLISKLIFYSQTQTILTIGYIKGINSATPLEEEEYNSTNSAKSAPNLSLHPIHSLTGKDIEKAVMDRQNYENYELVTSGEESKIICFISGVILAILVLITVIVILTTVLARKEIQF